MKNNTVFVIVYDANGYENAWWGIYKSKEEAENALKEHGLEQDEEVTIEEIPFGKWLTANGK